MPKGTPSPPTSAGSPPPAVVSASLVVLQAELDDERAAHRATEAALRDAEAARQTAEARAARLEAENAQSAEQISRLEHLNKELRKALFGPRSEKLGEDERQLSFEEFWAAIAEAGGQPEADDQEQDEEAGGNRRRRSPRGSRSGVRFGSHIDRREEVIEPDTIMCPCGCGEMTKIGEDRSERLDYEPAKFTVIETVRPRYACNKCKGGGVVQASAPASLVEGGLPTEALLAHVLIAKYGDHLPLYRQSQIYERSGIEVHRATLATWVGQASFHLRPVVDCLTDELKKSNNLGLDETTIRVLDPGRGKTKTGYMWTLVRDERHWSGADPPGVVYRYAPGRGGKYGAKLLGGFSGTVQLDAYSGHNILARADRRGGPVTRALCWSHARRKLKEVYDSSTSPIALAGLQRIAKLYAIEEKIRGEPPATRQAIRWEESAPIVNAFGIWLDEQRSRVSPRSRLGEKLAYIANQWDGLLEFLYDGRVEIDSNLVENRIRPLKTMESFCTPCSSIWKHWDLFPARGSMWMSPPPVGHGLGDILGMKVCNLDLPRRSGNDLPGGQLSHLDQTPDDMTGDAELLRGFEHGAPNAVLVGGEMGVNAVHAADRADPLGRPGLVLPGAHAHPVERCGDMVVGPPSCHVPHDGQGLIGGPASVLATPRLLNP